MRKILTGAVVLLLAAAVPAAAAAGDPQRSDEVPPGLAKAFAKMTPGLARALVATEGANSRLQDLPVSP